MDRTRAENATRKNCQRSVWEYPRRKRPAGKPRKRWLDDAENFLKKMGEAGEKQVGTETPGNWS